MGVAERVARRRIVFSDCTPNYKWFVVQGVSMAKQETVDDLLRTDPLDHSNFSTLAGTETQNIIIRSAQADPDEPISEFAARMPASESYVRDVLKRAQL